MDTLLGLLSSESSFFGKHISELAQLYSDKGFDALIHRLRNPPRKIDNSSSNIKGPEHDGNKSSMSTTIESKQGNDVMMMSEKGEKQSYVSSEGKETISEEFKCPLTLEIMKDPVIAADGFSYERMAIEDWLKKSNTSPMTNLPLENKNLIPNLALRKIIQEKVKH
eukprot:TRINITY_DN5973_c0_g1_i1.p1 TRINITY_DN5973_c0_g1~~TRINITY_DN5973_c0_g1_i1.p1  ORF type:complete len:193 (+),score=29.58 TRINITY_DN5973_c0_g1_i1:84-581(+)